MKQINTSSHQHFKKSVPSISAGFRSTPYLCLMIALLCLIINDADAQTSSNQIILYKDFSFLNSSDASRQFAYGSGALIDYGYAVALHQVKDERTYKQWELKVAFDKETEAARAFKFQEYQLSYRKGKYWKNPFLKVIQPRHSLGLHLNHVREDLEPMMTSDFPVERRYIALGIEYIFGLEIAISKGFNFHLDASLLSVSFGSDETRLRNPTLTLRQQRNGGLAFDAILQRVFKSGVGIDL